MKPKSDYINVSFVSNITYTVKGKFFQLFLYKLYIYVVYLGRKRTVGQKTLLFTSNKRREVKQLAGKEEIKEDELWAWYKKFENTSVQCTVYGITHKRFYCI